MDGRARFGMWAVGSGLLALLSGCFSSSTYSSPDFGASSVIMSAVNVPADPNKAATVRVTARRGHGEPLAGLIVRIEADKCSVVQPTAPTDATGHAEASVASAQIGEHSVQAFVGPSGFSSPLDSNVTVNFYAPADGNSAVPLGGLLNSQVVAQTPSGDVDSSYAGTVHFTSTDLQATLPADYTFTGKDRGAHVFVGALILRTPGLQTVTATDVATHQLVSQETFFVAVPDLGEAVLQLAGLQQNLVAGGEATFEVSALDTSGHAVPGYVGSVTFSSSDPQAQLPPVYRFTAADQGVASFKAVLRTAGSQWIAATDALLTSNQARTSVTSAAAVGFGVSGVVPGPAGSQSTVTVTAADAFGNQAMDYHGTVHFASSDPNAQLPAEAVYMAANEGTKTFTHGVALTQVGTQSVSVWDTSDPNIAGSQTGVVVTPGAPASIGVSNLTSSVIAGQALSPRVAVLDAYANVVTSFTGAVQFGSNDTAAQLPPLTSLQAGDHGVYTFSNALTFKTSGPRWLTVASVDAPAVRGSLANITVQPAPAASLAVTGLADTVDVGYAGSLTVTARDVYGNVATNYAGKVTFSSTDGRAALPASATFGASAAGSMTFSGGVTLRTQGDQNIVAVDAVAGIGGQRHVSAVKVTGLFGGIGYASCALFSNGALKCWGYNNEGELGLGDTVYRGPRSGQMGSALPAVDLGSVKPSALSLGDRSACATLLDGSVKCWGYNQYGELGLGDVSNRGSKAGQMGSSLPALLLGSSSATVAVGVGYSHACALLADHSVKCWGSNSHGELGVGDSNGRGGQMADMGSNLHAVALGSGVQAAQMAAGYGHTCVLTGDGKVKCWGYNYTGELGLGDMQGRGDSAYAMGDSLPFVQLNAAATQLALGYFTSCAVLSDATLKCWGGNTSGQLGLGDSTPRGYISGQMGFALPTVSLGSGRSVLGVTAGAYHVCALLDTHQVKCWGDNYNASLGLGDTTQRGSSSGQMGDNLPVVSLGRGRTVQRVVAGGAHTCALLDDNQIKCWGANSLGQLGLGDTSNRGGASSDMGDGLPAVVLW